MSREIGNGSLLSTLTTKFCENKQNYAVFQVWHYDTPGQIPGRVKTFSSLALLRYYLKSSALYPNVQITPSISETYPIPRKALHKQVAQRNKAGCTALS